MAATVKVGRSESAIDPNTDSCTIASAFAPDLEAGYNSVNRFVRDVEVRNLQGKILFGPVELEASTPLDDIKRRIKREQEESTKKTLSVKLFLQDTEALDGMLLSELAAHHVKDGSILRLNALFHEDAGQPPQTEGEVPIYHTKRTRWSKPSWQGVLPATPFLCPLCLSVAAMWVANEECGLHAWITTTIVLAGLQVLTLVLGIGDVCYDINLHHVLIIVICLQVVGFSIAIWGFILQAQQRDTCISAASNLVVASSCAQVVLTLIWCCGIALGVRLLEVLGKIHDEG